MNFQVEFYSVECETESIAAPYFISSNSQFEASVILAFDVDRPNDDSADFTIPSSDRNVVALAADCEVKWIIESPDERGEIGDSGYFGYTSRYNGRLIIKQKSDPRRFHEVSLETGEIIDTWNNNQFQIGETLVEFDSKIRQTIYHCGVYVIASQTTLYGVDSTGEKLWEKPIDYKLKELDRELPPDGKVWILDQRFGGEDELYVWAKMHQGRNPREYIFRLDVETGKFVEAHNGPDAWLDG